MFSFTKEKLKTFEILKRTQGRKIFKIAVFQIFQQGTYDVFRLLEAYLKVNK